MRKRLGVPTVLSLALLAHAAAAYGAPTTASPTDPSAGSPAGAVYQLPFEKGRADAAPKGNGGTGAPAPGPGGGGGGGSGNGGSIGSIGSSGEPDLYRSENNFGSSSHVPGVGAGGTQGGAGNGAGSGGGGAGGESGSGSGSGLSPGELTDSGNTSSTANIGLLLVIGLVAAGVGYVSIRGKHLRQS